MERGKIYLRELRECDVKGMIEWMQDKDIQKNFRRPMLTYTEEHALNFIKKARYEREEGANIHFAIVNTQDEYLGTISLKEMDLESRSAEYAIVLRKSVQGRGYAKEATRLILEKAFDEYDLERIYLNVLSENRIAQELYKRCGFVYEGEVKNSVCINGMYHSLQWYSILKKEYKGWG